MQRSFLNLAGQESSSSLLCTYLGETAPEHPPVSLNSLFLEDSVSIDSDEDLAEELDEFSRFLYTRYSPKSGE